MKTVSDLLDRAFILLLLADRGLLEKESHSGGKYSLSERESKRIEFESIMDSRGLNESMSPTEINIIRSDIGKLTEESYYDTQFQYEAIPILLWAVNLNSFPKYTTNFCEDDFHPLIGLYRTDRWQHKPTLHKQKELRIHYGMSFLWHWRSREGIESEAFKTEPADKLIRRIFSSEFDSAIPDIPMTNEEPADFSVMGVRYSELDETSAYRINIISKWRHHALEWILNNNSWENTETNT